MPGDDLPLPLRERIAMRVEHTVDTKLVQLAIWMLRTTNFRLARLYRRKVLVLTTTGRRTGRPRSVPLQYFPDGKDLIVVAANSGMPSPPAWYLNLKADPHARVELPGRAVGVHAEELTADEAGEFWAQILATAPDYARYRRRTDRPIPLLRLVPDASAP